MPGSVNAIEQSFATAFDQARMTAMADQLPERMLTRMTVGPV